MNEFAVTECGAKGLAYVKVEENNTISAGISKFFNEIMTEELLKVYAKPNDAVFFIADEDIEKAQYKVNIAIFTS